MRKIKSIYDAIIKTKVLEDQCTNFLVYILDKLPKSILIEIIKAAQLKTPDFSSYVDINVQYHLAKSNVGHNDSRPDATIEFAEGKFLLLETKRFQDSFDANQFHNHYYNGIKAFGNNNVWCLFLSKDSQCPSDLKKLKKRYGGKVGFISWKELIEVLDRENKTKKLANSILIDEFIIFAKHYKLHKLITMNKQELKTFIRNYSGVALKQDEVQEYFNKCIEDISQRILESKETVKLNDDYYSETLPCFYRTFNIKSWHIKKPSAYVFIDVLLKKVGVILYGFEDKTESKKLQLLWDKKYKQIYSKNATLTAVTWIGYGEDDFAIGEDGYFKPIPSSSGKLFNPLDVPEIRESECFYWGVVSDLDLENINDEVINKIATDFKNLLSSFLNNNK